MLSYYKSLNSRALKTNLFVALTWGISLLGYAYGVVASLPLINKFASAFIPTVVVLVVLITFSSIRSNIRVADYIFVYFSVAIYLLHWFLLFPENAIYCEDIWVDYLLCCLPFYFVGLIVNPNEHIKTLENISILSIIIIISYYYLKITKGEINTEVYSGSTQGLAFKLLPHTLLLLSSIIKRFNLLSFICVFLSVFTILGTGNRSSLLILLIFLLSDVVIIKKSFKTKIFFLLLVGVAILGFISYLPHISDSLTSFGLNTRSISRIVEGDFIESSGRSQIYGQLLSSINEQSFWGQGFCADRAITSTHEYSHNLLIELILTFGFLFGGIFFILIIYLIFYALKYCKTDVQKSFWLVLFFSGFFLLFISESFLSYHYFYLMIGYSIGVIRIGKYKKIIQK